MNGKLTTNDALIVSGSDKGFHFIAELLPKNDFPRIDRARSAGEAKRMLLNCQYDIIFINTPLSDEMGYDFAMSLPEDSPSCIMLIVKNEVFDDISHRVENYGILTVPKPLSKQIFYHSLKLLCAMREKLRLMEKKNASLVEKMNEIRLVNRAKWILIDYLKMNEAQAHRYIEKQAMDMRVTRKEIAETLIRTYEN